MTPTDDPPPPPQPADLDGAGLACPLCGYDLRGLAAPRCPECGHAFDADALRAARDRPAWFFEAAPPRRRARAFALTTLSSLWPPDLWRRVRPGDAIDARRLRAWAAIWLAAAVAASALVLIAGATRLYLDANAPPVPVGIQFANGVIFAQSPRVGFTWPDALARVAGDRRLGELAWCALAAFAWPLAARLVLGIFGVTFARAGIHAGHLWRCVLYAIPSLLIPPLAGAAFVVAGTAPDEVTPIVVLAMAWLSSAHLTMAHVRYLRVRHAAAQAISVQIIVGLGTLAAFALAFT